MLAQKSAGSANTEHTDHHQQDMPPRLNKRQLRELEELQSLEASTSHQDTEESDEEELEFTSPQGHSAGFAALAPVAQAESASEDEDVVHTSKSKKKKKKKKPSGISTPSTPAAAQPVPSSQPAASPSSPIISKKERKALKKQKAKAVKDEGDDLDKALAALSIKYPELRRPAQDTAAAESAPALISLLQVSLNHLDSEAEMRKFFGAKVISASKASSSTPNVRRPAVAAKSHLTRPQPTWWPASYRQGLSVRPLTDDETAERQQKHGWTDNALEEKVWTVEYSRKYRGVTKMFMQMVMSGDPEGLFQLLRSFPYHADTLLQLSEVYFHREEHSTAADFIDRALFTYERAFVGSFNFTSGINRMDFDRVENRPFFLAVHRQVSDLVRRGCVRTAFEFARLLFSLDPATDPHGALLHLDYLAIKAGMHDWLLEFWDAQCSLSEDAWRGRMHVRGLPGWAYARALALFVKEESKHDTDHVQSSKALIEAVRAFPSVAPLLADKADMSLSSDIRGHNTFRIHPDASSLGTEQDAIKHLLSHLYALRSSSLWKPKVRAAWFTATLNTFAKSLTPTFSPPISPTSPSPSECATQFTSVVLRHSVYRHVIVLESITRAGRLFGFVPPQLLAGKQLACDPLPPPSRVSEYDATFFVGAEDPTTFRPRGRRGAQRMLERLLPDPVFRRQLQDFFDANPAFAQRFPGGIVEFAQFAGELPDDVLEDLMIAAVNAPQDRGMPGQMPGHDIFEGEDVDNMDDQVHLEPVGLDRGDVDDVVDDVEGEEDGEEEEEEDEDVDVAPLPVRILRNVMNRFWGGNANETVESSEDEDEGTADDVARDDQGVD